MKYLLDTCIVSELMKRNPSKRVVEWVRGCDEERQHLSVLTFGELQKGIAKLPSSRRKSRLWTWVDQDLRRRFEGRTLPIDQEVAERWGAMAAESERAGRPIPAIDGLLAATALVHGLTIVTRNTADIEPSGVEMFDPWRQ